MRSPRSWVVVTAADRAAATFAACGGEPLRPHIAGEGVPPQRIPFSHLAHPPYADTRKADGTRHQLFLYPVAPSPTLHVRGGSVSRRGLNQLAGNRTPLSGGTTCAEAANPNASRSSGERGLGGEALLSEKRPLPPEFPRSLYHFDAEFFADLGAVAAANAFRLVANALAVFDVKGSLTAAGYALTAATAVIVNHQAAGLAPRPR